MLFPQIEYFKIIFGYILTGALTPILSSQSLRIMLVNTNIERNTKDLVTRVREKYELHPKIVKPILEAMDGISETCLATLEKIATAVEIDKNYRTLEDLIDVNQSLLHSLGVSHPALQDVCQIFSQFGRPYTHLVLLFVDK